MARYNKQSTSSLLKIKDEYTAFCVDEFAMAVYNLMMERDDDGEFVNKFIWEVEEKKPLSMEETIARLNGK